jgi:ATP-binding cassette subfamily B protein
MNKKGETGIAYVLSLTGKNRLLLYASAPFAVLSGLCAIMPYTMVYQTFLCLFDGNRNLGEALRYGIIAVIAIALKFLFNVVSLSFSHIGAFNTLYSVRREISRHIALLGLGFFTDNTMGEIKKVLIEDVERLEKFLAHQIPDIVSAVVIPLAVFGYMLSLNVPMALENLPRGKTVIMIAHRLGTIIGADNILVLDRGRIAESGSHTELLQKGGWYARMYEEQKKAKNWRVSGRFAQPGARD